MPKWISIGEAAHKYGVKEADICMWAELGAISAYFTDTTLMINEKSLRKYQWLRKSFPVSEYVHTLEQLCINQSETCKLYTEVIELQKQDLQRQEHRISMLEKQQTVATRQIKLYHEIIAIITNTPAKAETGWLEKLRIKFRKQKQDLPSSKQSEAKGERP